MTLSSACAYMWRPATVSAFLIGPLVPVCAVAMETPVLFFALQDEGAQPLNLSSRPKAAESKSPTSPASPQVPALKLGPGSLKHSAPASISSPPTRAGSLGTAYHPPTWDSPLARPSILQVVLHTGLPV